MKIKDGEWTSPVMSGYKMKCCDCGLVHSLDFAIVDKNGQMLNGASVVFRAYRVDKKKKKTAGGKK